MSVISENDGSEDVNDFLLRIRELGDKRDQEDEERTRKLEQEILQGRKERQARRAERARSLSPTKDSPSRSGTPTSMLSAMDISVHEGVSDSPSQHPKPLAPHDPGLDNTRRDSNSAPSVAEARRPSRDPPYHSAKPISSSTSPSASMPLSRAGTLSWQQRPISRGSTGVRSRPLSMVATENNAAKSPRAGAEQAPASDLVTSRTQITQSLGSKDPAWFKQTEDRGLGSAAYRRNQGEIVLEKISTPQGMPLPGLSRGTSVETDKDLTVGPAQLHSNSPSREGSMKGDSDWKNGSSQSTSISSANAMRSPLPTLNSQKFVPPSSETISVHSDDSSPAARALAMSPSQGRISPERIERPNSPTKGLGGFVQSAMLKRSDSVNKRWSAQPGTGLSRGNSMASNRSGYEGPRQPLPNMSPPREPRPSSFSRDNSPISTSRPESSHSNVTITQNRGESERPSTSSSLGSSKPEASSNDAFIRPALPQQKSIPAFTELEKHSQETDPERNLPTSPSKKWSPTKSSWLENAINKPDSPKPKAPPQQPSWMAEINRAKQQRGSVDLGKSEPHREVTTGGLIRSPPLGVSIKNQSIGGLPSGFSAGVAKTIKGAASEGQVATRSTEDVKPEEKLQDLPAVTKLMESRAVLGDSSQKGKTTVPAIKTPEKPPAVSDNVSQVEPVQVSLVSNKLKPDTPPKKDFRSTLKTRQVSGGKESNDDAEFKNVFGKLKRTQTQNYVAPDELKDNILRGKAGLATSGGPKKTERRDELKDSIMKQKEAMKMAVAAGSTRKTSGSSVEKSPDPLIPEAIAKRKGLIRSESTLSNGSTEGGRSSSKPEAIAELQRLRDKPKPILPLKTSTAPGKGLYVPVVKAKLGNTFNSSLAGLISRGPSPVIDNSKPNLTMNPSALVNNSDDSTAGSDQASANGSQLIHMTKSRARGPKRRIPTTVTSNVVAEPISLGNSLSKEQLSGSASSASIQQLNPQSAPLSPGRVETLPLASISNNDNRKASQPRSPRKPSTSIAPLEVTKNVPPSSQTSMKEPIISSTKTTSVVQPISVPNSNDEQTTLPLKTISAVQPKPVLHPKDDFMTTPSKTASIVQPKQAPNQNDSQIRQSSISSPRILPATPVTPLKPQPLPSISMPDAPQESKKSKSQENERPLPSVRGAAAVWQQSPVSTPQRARSPIKLPTRKDEEAAMEEAGLSQTKAKGSVGLGIQIAAEVPERTAPLDHNLPSPPMRSPKSPPLPAKKPALTAGRVISNTISPKAKPERDQSSVSQNPEIRRLFSDFFDEFLSSTAKVNLNTQSILASSSSGGDTHKIKTLRKQIWEVTGHGKSVPVPSHQEHILFEENLYLCTHVFGSAAGTRTTEVYLWCGDAVGSSAVEDAQLFARKVAKDHNGKLIILKQGKETPNFFEALGGIVITRRGSSSRDESASSSAATYMLCGRRHVGQIAFDEVDFQPQSLCSGFPYIISARFGKLYLWKGTGSGADELGCARLIGMDLGLTGEIEEVDEGREPAAFWESFPGGKPRDLAMSNTNTKLQDWNLKPSCEKYAMRLFSVDLEAPRLRSITSFASWGRRGSAPSTEDGTPTIAQIKEINPFTCSDLAEDGIYVLDAFFQVYVIALPPSPTSKSHKFFTFRTSLLFAQEYAILAASLEDRPLVPNCSVIFGGRPGEQVPEEMRRAFRKWNGEKERRMWAGVRILGLGEALKACG